MMTNQRNCRTFQEVIDFLNDNYESNCRSSVQQVVSIHESIEAYVVTITWFEA